jgi:hypothetical protein
MPYLFLAKLIAIAACVAALAYGVHRVTEHYRDQGRTEVQALWDKDKAARIKRTTEITLELMGKLTAAQDAARKQEQANEVRFASLAAQAAAVHNTVAGIRIDSDLARLLLDASSAANSARPGTGTETRADPVPAAAQAATYDERELATYLTDASRAYADAYVLWRACRNREDAMIASMLKGASP